MRKKELEGGAERPPPSKKTKLGPRAFAHVDGNWTGQVYINVDKSLPGLEAIVSACFAAVEPIILAAASSSEPCDHWHVSLSKPFTLRFHQIEPFLIKLAFYLKRVRLLLNTFLSIYPEYTILSNEDSTKSFLCIPIDDGDGSLKKLVDCVDSALGDFGQPRYFEHPIFHTSISTIFPVLCEADIKRIFCISINKELNHSTDSNQPVSASQDHSVPSSLSQLFPYCDSSSCSDNDSDSGDLEIITGSQLKRTGGIEDSSRRSEPQAEKEYVTPLQDYKMKLDLKVHSCVRIPLTELECKIGNRIYVYPLQLTASGCIVAASTEGAVWTLKTSIR